MVLQEKLNNRCATTECNKCPIGLNSPLCTIIQQFYPICKFKNVLKMIKEEVNNAENGIANK